MRAVLIILLFLLILIDTCTTVFSQEDFIYPLIDNSSVLSSDIISFQNDMVLEYNKNFEFAPPENTLLWKLFTLNQSFKSTVLLSYYGSVGYAIRESNTPITTIVYLNQTQYGHFLGIPFGRGVYLNDNEYYESDGYHYAYITNVYNLNSSIAADLAKRYYDLDYARYIEANAQLKPMIENNSKELNASLNEYIEASREGNETKVHFAKLKYLRLAEALGYSEPSTRKILEDEEKKNLTPPRFAYTPLRHTLISAIINIILGIIFILVYRKIKTYKEQGKEAGVAFISSSLDLLLSMGGFAYFISYSPSSLVALQFWVGFQWLIVIASWLIGAYLTLKYA